MNKILLLTILLIFTFTQINAQCDLAVTVRKTENVSCKGGNDGFFSLDISTSPGPLNVQWKKDGANIWVGLGYTSKENLSAGLYTGIVSITRSGCTAEKTVEFVIKEPIEELTTRLLSSQNPSCFGSLNGKIDIVEKGGTSPYTYDWTPGMPTGDGTRNIVNLPTGTYTCTVTDLNGCKSNISKTITEPNDIDFTLQSQTNVACFGGNNGVLSISRFTGGPANGNENYQWSRTSAPNVLITPINNATSSTISNLTADSYTCLVTKGSCTKSKSFIVNQPDLVEKPINLLATPATLNSPISLSATGCEAGILVWYNALAPTIALPNNTPTITKATSNFFAKCITNSCESVVSDNLIVNICLSVADVTIVETTQTTAKVTYSAAILEASSASIFMRLASEDFLSIDNVTTNFTDHTFTNLIPGTNYNLYIAWSGCRNNYGTNSFFTQALKIPFQTEAINNLSSNPISITSSPGVLIPNFPLQKMIGVSATPIPIDNSCGSKINNYYSDFGKDLWYSITTGAIANLEILIRPILNSTQNFMGAELYDSNGNIIACDNNNGTNSNGGFRLKAQVLPPPNARSAAPKAQTYLLRVYELNFFSPTNFNASGSFLISPSLSPLPINLISFFGKNYEKGNLLEWKTANEKDFSGFEIQKSNDAKMYEKIGFVFGEKTELYTFLDENSGNGGNYYRLKMIDLDGSFEYSKVIFLRNNMEVKLKLFPNPIKNSFEIIGIEPENIANILIKNSSGKLLFKPNISNKKIDISELPNAIYFAHIELINGKHEVLKLVKQ
jgi:hypothetical protein